MTDLVELMLALLGIVDRWVVAVLVEMTSCNQAVSSCNVLSIFMRMSHLRPNIRREQYHYCQDHRLRECSFLYLGDGRGRLLTQSTSSVPKVCCQGDQRLSVRLLRHTSLRDRKTSKLHQLVKGETSFLHEVLVEGRSIFGRNCLSRSFNINFC